MYVKRQRVSDQVVQGELASSPRCVPKTSSFIKHAFVLLFFVERVGIIDDKPKPRRSHFMRVLELHMQLDSVAPQTDVVRRDRSITESQSESEAIDVKANCLLDVAGA